MADIADLDERRRKRQAETKDLWHCTGCGSHEFNLATDGFVKCASCHNMIEDLAVVKIYEGDS